jgi:phospholipase C
MPMADPIKHVVLLMMENHSFDQMIGCLQGEYPDLEGIDINSPSQRFNLDLSGKKVYQIRRINSKYQKTPNMRTDLCSTR